MRNYFFNGFIFALCASCLLGEPSLNPSEVNKSNKAKNSFYTVVKGDNIDSIAKKLGVSRDTIIELNPEIDPAKLRLGAKIKTSVALDNVSIVEKGDTISQDVTPKGYTKLKRFATFEDYDNYRLTVCKDYLAAYNVIKNKLANATPDEIKTYKDNAEKLIELQKCSKAYLRYNQIKSTTTEVDLKGSETFSKEQFQKIYSQISLIEITTDLQTPVTPEQIKSGADFVVKLKDLIALKPKFYIGKSKGY